MRPSESVIFQSIEGWLSNEEADALYDAALHVPEYGAIVEIGCFKGRSTYALALAAFQNYKVTVFAVDPFTGNPREHKFFPAGFGEDFARNLDAFIRKGYVVTLVMSSGGALMRGLRPDLVFVDGSHIYEDALFDMMSWWRKLVPGGRMAVHDTTGTHPPVREALLTFLTLQNVRVEAVTGSISWLRKKQP